MPERGPPLVSIVTPSRDQAEFLPDALRSVAGQDHPRVEHIVMDGASSDGTVEILKAHRGRHELHWESRPDGGQSDALNRGFRRARGEIVGWLNADDRYLPGAVSAVVRFFETHPGVDVVYGDYRCIDRAGRPTRVRKEIPFDLFVLKYLHVLFVPSTATFFRRRIFDEGNFLDPSYHYAMDYEFFLRLATAGYRFAHLPRILADFRWHGDNKSTKGRAAQDAERERALLALDPWLGRMAPGAGRRWLRRALLVAARAKRTMAKLRNGAYAAGVECGS